MARNCLNIPNTKKGHAMIFLANKMAEYMGKRHGTKLVIHSVMHGHVPSERFRGFGGGVVYRWGSLDHDISVKNSPAVTSG